MHGARPTLRIGILIIGSLFWDNSERAVWRRERLVIEDKQRIRARIRYGRESTAGSRKGTFTMTFSGSAAPGIAYVVPCRNEISDPAGLLEEARLLARAEKLDGAARWKQFGAIGLLLRNADANRLALELRASWAQYFQTHLDPSCATLTCCATNENAPLGGDGLLQMPWPAGLDAEVNLDGVLATVNTPTIVDGRYLGPKKIASSLVHAAKNANYLCENVLAGIRTFEDRSIWHHICALDPPFIREPEYSERFVRLVNMPLTSGCIETLFGWVRRSES